MLSQIKHVVPFEMSVLNLLAAIVIWRVLKLNKFEEILTIARENDSSFHGFNADANAAWLSRGLRFL
jgi:hypothetical protein